MGHDLATTNGRPAIFYAGASPWHGLGTSLDNPATSSEAIQAAGLDYTVRLASLATCDGTPVPQRRAVIRGDTGAVLGVVGNGYVPVQNDQAFKFLDALVSDDGLRYHTAGALGRGERVWMLAKVPGEIRIKNSDDITEKYLLLSNSHDGTSALRVYFTGVRVVCHNTLVLANRLGRGKGVSIRHKGNLKSKIWQARVVLDLGQRFFDDLAGQFDRLSSVYPSTTQLRSFFEGLYPDPPSGEKARAENIRQTLFRLYEQGVGQDLPATRHTGFAALNAVTEYVDHHRPSRGRSEHDRADRRLESNWFGTGADLKAKALGLALEMFANN